MNWLAKTWAALCLVTPVALAIPTKKLETPNMEAIELLECASVRTDVETSIERIPETPVYKITLHYPLRGLTYPYLIEGVRTEKGSKVIFGKLIAAIDSSNVVYTAENREFTLKVDEASPDQGLSNAIFSFQYFDQQELRRDYSKKQTSRQASRGASYKMNCPGLSRAIEEISSANP